MVDDRDELDPNRPHTAVIDRSSLLAQLERIQNRRAMLVFLSGSSVGGMVPLDVTEVVLGRDADCDVVLTDDGVSRRHARVRLISAGAFVIEDMGSTNGTTVNGEPVTLQVLRDGDRVALGRTVVKFLMQAQIDEDYQKQIYEMSIRDGLTKVYNRRYFDDRLLAEVAYARRHLSLVSLMMFDLDHFKAVNDTYGHVGGDRVLAGVAAFVQAQVRSEDVLARYGGEEFVVLVRDTPPAGVDILSDRIRRGVEALRVTYQEATLAVTVSVGVMTVRGNKTLTPEWLIEAADRLMYRAKSEGRNRVCAETVGV